jgi:hypothetical protein
MKYWTLCLLWAASTLVLGCAGQSVPAPSEESTAPSGEAPATVATEQAEGIPLTIASWDETQDMIAEHRGKVVVVDLWTTW